MATQPTEPLQRSGAEQGRVLPSDQNLLRRFAAERDDAAFEALVQRHHSLVLRVCKRTLGNHHDAEDVCQAVFLVLARKAASTRWQRSIGKYLCKVAHRLARDARTCPCRKRHSGSTMPFWISAEQSALKIRRVKAAKLSFW